MSAGYKLVVYSILCLIWSSTWLMIKVGLAGAPPFTAAGIRLIIASFVIFVILHRRRIKLPRSAAFYRLSLFLGTIQMGAAYGLVYWGEQYISSGLAAILFSSMPLLVAILARLFVGESLSPAKVAGILLGVAGVYVIFSDSVALGGPQSVYGITAVLGSVLCTSVSTVTIKKYATEYHPFAAMSLPVFIGGIILAVCGLLFERDRPVDWNYTTIFSILYLAVFGSVIAFGLYFWIIKHIEVTVLSYQTFLLPIIAGVLGWIFLGETVTLRVVIGGSMILAGIALAILTRARIKRHDVAGP
ncbi:MAG: EamA family transporter [Candidatus Krumholzibacteria bacterium]